MKNRMNQDPPAGPMPQRPVTLLIAALGGEGGGLLADWVVAAAMDCNYPVQSTSIPGVAQRTGATSYYLEIYPVPADQLNGRMPVMALTPTPGAVDVLAASELIEAGRALQNGYIDAQRTRLVASTHRVYAIAEKILPGDARVDSEKVLSALRAGSSQASLFDMSRLAQEHTCQVNAVLFGALAGCGALPLSRTACEQAIRSTGKAAPANLRGFAAGYAHAERAVEPAPAPAQTRPAAAQVERVRLKFPAETFAVLEAGVARLIDYQDAAYAALYLDRLEPILALDREAGGAAGGYRLTCETGRQLALWMSFEDLIRVADLKTRNSRFQRVRQEVGALKDDLLVVRDYMKPGLDELCALLPPRAALRLQKWDEKRSARQGRKAPLALQLQLKSTSVSGFLLLRGLGCLKRWRRSSSRYQSEHALMERWLGAIRRLGFAVQDLELAFEIAQCARLVQGYGATRSDGVKQFEHIFNTIIEKGNQADPKKLSAAIRRACNAAAAHPDAAPAVRKSMHADPGKPVFWMARATARKAVGEEAGACAAALRQAKNS